MDTDQVSSTTTKFKNLLSPYQIGSHQVKNRIVSTAHAPGFDTGLLNERHIKYLERKAVGGHRIDYGFWFCKCVQVFFSLLWIGKSRGS